MYVFLNNGNKDATPSILCQKHLRWTVFYENKPLIVHTLSWNETASSCATNSKHQPCNLHIFPSVVATNPENKESYPKTFEALNKLRSDNKEQYMP